jgi:hypothetical protein
VNAIEETVIVVVGTLVLAAMPMAVGAAAMCVVEMIGYFF